MSVMSEITAFSRGLSPVSPYMHSIPGLNKGVAVTLLQDYFQ